MNVETTTLGGLNCRVVENVPDGDTPELVVILCHGFGAPGDDLVGLAPELMRMNADISRKVRFIFPEAPLSLDALGMYGGRAWWHIDIARMTAAIEKGEFRDQRNELPEGLIDSRESLTTLIEEVRTQTQLPISKFVLGGFSQGSMLAIDVALRLPESPAALSIFSGTLLCEQEWRELAKARTAMPVLQSHGRVDSILPFEAAEWLHDLLVQAGLDVEFIPFEGIHTIPMEALQALAALLGRIVGDDT